jgi:hypothetical protein
MRIAEERDRREREAVVLARLPRALEELYRNLATCVESYVAAFGAEAADVQFQGSRIRVTVREELEGKWQQLARIEIVAAAALPGFRVERAGDPLLIEVGMLAGDKLFYKDRDQDQFLSMEELTRRILDRAFFPRLGE